MTTHSIDSQSINPQDGSAEGTRCSRRTFLVATATTAMGAFLAACASDGGSPEGVHIEPDEVPLGSAVIKGEYIIAQPEEGKFHAYSRICPHQGARIGVVDGNTVICKAHGSVFDIATGNPVAGPSREPLAGASIAQEGTGLIVGS